jgi:hypothetical protein
MKTKMRTGSRILIVVGMITWAVSGYAQADYAFKVLANKGANEYKSGDTWQPIKTGISLKVGDELKVSENAYLGLVSQTGKPLEIKKPGTSKVADLLKQVGTGTSVMAKYTDFILSSNSAEAKKNRLSATGAVHRGGPGALNVYLPGSQSSVQNNYLYNNTMYVVWEKPTSGGPYVVTLMDFMEEELLKVETPETSVKLDLSDPKLAKVSNFLVKVSSKADSKAHSEGNAVKRLTAAEHEKIRKSYDEISGDVKEETAFSRFLLAGFYEQHGLLIDALSCYEDAVRMAPDVESFTEARNDFLERNNLLPQKP